MAELCLGTFTWENGLHKPLCHDRLSHILYVTCNKKKKKEEKSYDAGRPGNEAAVLVSAFFFLRKKITKCIIRVS